MAVLITSLFASSQLTGSATTFYTVPSQPTTTVLSRGRVRFTNTDSASHAITAYAVPSGGAAGVGNVFMDAESVAANSHVDVDLPLMGPGATLQAFADTASKVTILPIDGVLFS